MFTGIIEATGLITNVSTNGTNKTFHIKSPISALLKVDQSVSHNGTCLTVESVDGDEHQATAIAETLQVTSLRDWDTGQAINLERCMQMNGRLDGHIVQGHVDTVATCLLVEDKAGSWEYTFQYPEKFTNLLIEKGSVCLNGISLTVFSVTENTFKVAIIPYTYKYTTMNSVVAGTGVNIEFDVIGKYVAKSLKYKI